MIKKKEIPEREERTATLERVLQLLHLTVTPGEVSENTKRLVYQLIYFVIDTDQLRCQQ